MVSLSGPLMNGAGQVVENDAYFNLTDQAAGRGRPGQIASRTYRIFVRAWRAMRKRPCSEMMNEEIPANGQRIARLPGFGAEDVGVE